MLLVTFGMLLIDIGWMHLVFYNKFRYLCLKMWISQASRLTNRRIRNNKMKMIFSWVVLHLFKFHKVCKITRIKNNQIYNKELKIKRKGLVCLLREMNKVKNNFSEHQAQNINHRNSKWMLGILWLLLEKALIAERDKLSLGIKLIQS